MYAISHKFLGHICWALGLILFLGGCSQYGSMQEKIVPIDKMQWSHDFNPWIDMEIEDTTAGYNIFAVVRHTQQFKYNNLIIRFSMIRPGDSAKMQQVNLPLGNRKGWLGDTLGSMVETRIKINQQPVHLSQGTNSFVFSQLMPEDPLGGIANMGVRLEKVPGK